MFHAFLPLKYWVDAFLTTSYLINRMPLSTLNMQTPYYKLFFKSLDYSGLRVLGCKYFPYLQYYNTTKFQRKTYPCVFIGYSPMHKGYKCLEP